MGTFSRRRTIATQTTSGKLDFGQYEDVIGNPEINDDRLKTNIAPLGSGEGNSSMNWGYRGGGPLTLAFNVLYLYTEGDRMFSHRNAEEFREDFLLATPQDQPLRIKANDIVGWINAREGVFNV